MDLFKNFAKSTLASGITSGATSLSVASGHGTRFPTVPFNAVLWNKTDFADPSDDSNHEIVRVTAISTDTFTITRGQEGTTGVAHNTGGKTYGIIVGLTAKSLAELQLVAVRATQLDKTSTSFSNALTVPGLVAGERYAIRAVLQLTPSVLGGAKFDFDASSLTATTFSMFGWNTSEDTDGLGYIPRFSALATDFYDTIGPTILNIVLEGFLRVDAAGDLVLRFAQSASNGTSSLLIGSYLEARRL